MKIRYLTITMLVAALLPISAETLDELYEIALQNDTNIRSLELSMERTMLALERSEIGDSLDVSVYTVEHGLALSYDLDESDSFVMSVDPAVSVTLPNPPGTEIGASATLSIEPFEFSNPIINVSQSLDTLKPGNIDRQLEELSNRSTIISMRNTLNETRRNAKIQLLGDAKTILSHQRQIINAERSVQKQLDRIEEEETLGMVNKGSAHYLSMLNTLKMAERNLVALKRDAQRFIDRFSARTGITPEMFPQKLPTPELIIPDSYGPETNVTLFLTELSRERALLSLSQVDETSMSAGASYDFDETKIGASLNADFSLFSLNGAASYDIDDSEITASIGFGWSMNGKRLLEISRMEKQSSLVSAEIELELAVRDSLYALEDLISGVIEFEESEVAYAESLEYAELYLTETRELFESGIADAEALEDAEWDLAVAAYDGYELAIDRMILALRIEGFSEKIPE